MSTALIQKPLIAGPAVDINSGMSLRAPAAWEAAKPSFTAAEAAEYLNRQGYAWNGSTDPDDPENTLGQPLEITYAFRKTDSNYEHSGTDFSRFSVQQIQIAELALMSWSDVADITFTRVGKGETGPKVYNDNASILFGNIEGSTGAAYAYLPRGPGRYEKPEFADGDVWINVALAYEANPEMWEYGMQTMTHELGHALGLLHPGDYNASDNQPINYENSAEYVEDSRMWTVMSYWDESETGGDFDGFHAPAPLMHDIAAMQRLYGVNWEAQTGDTVYGFNSNTDRVWYTAESIQQTLIFCAFDAGGNDTFDFSGYKKGMKVDLNNGAFSNVNGMKNNISISAEVRGDDNKVVNIIENVLGGDGKDNLYGNNAGNYMAGNDGADKLASRKGADTLEGGGGADKLIGSKGSDVFLYSHLSDSTSGAGSDLIKDLSDVDVIDLSAIDADSTSAGDQAARLTGTSFDGDAGSLILRYNAGSNTTFLELDVDGDGDADFSVSIEGDHRGFDNFVL